MDALNFKLNEWTCTLWKKTAVRMFTVNNFTCYYTLGQFTDNFNIMVILVFILIFKKCWNSLNTEIVTVKSKHTRLIHVFKVGEVTTAFHNKFVV